MKRAEDLGVAKEKMRRLLDEDAEDLFRHCESKHSFEAFQKQYGEEEEGLWSLHLKLRWLKDRLEEIYSVLVGDGSCGD